MEQSGEVLHLAEGQWRQASAVLGRAFQDDPLTRYVIPDAARRARLLPSFFGTAVRYCLRYGEIYTTSALQGVACWLPPGSPVPTTGRILRLGPGALPLRLWPRELYRAAITENAASDIHHRVAPGPHWYLWVLGVDPPYQRRGVGSLLLRPILARADAARSLCYLETEKEENLLFYQRHGFKVAHAGKMGGSPVYAWALLREPGTQ